MRLSVLLLLLLQLCCCEDQPLRRHNRTVVEISVSVYSHQTLNIHGQRAPIRNVSRPLCHNRKEVTWLYSLDDALGGAECRVYKSKVVDCFSSCSRSMEGIRCGLEEAKCIQKIDFGNFFCRNRTNFLVKGLLLKGLKANAFLLVPEFGVSEQLYGNCSFASVKIEECAQRLNECIEKHQMRKARKGEVPIERYECSNQGQICLEPVKDIDRSVECAREVGYAWEVLGRRWKAKVDGDEKASSASFTPLNTVIDRMETDWGLSWWSSVCVLFALMLALTALFFCCCYCCAMAGVAKQKDQRRWKQTQKRGVDRYSDVESTQPTSVRVSRYEDSTEQ